MGSQYDISDERKIHLYNFCNLLRPRGSMEKESLSLYLKEKLHSVFHDWTDPRHIDSQDSYVVENKLIENLREEVELAIREFQNNIFKY